jgi:hypothetical protein
MWNKHNGANQRWSIVYVDQASKVPTKGLDTKFGLHINRPFFIVSRMPMRRVASASGPNGILRIQTRDVNRKNEW